MPEIILLSSAHIASRNSVLIENGGDGTTEIGCFSFLIKINGEWILLDTGIEDLAVANTTKSSAADWERNAEEFDLLSDLKRHGVKPEDVKKVFLTHSHYDHLSGITYFPHAKIYMSKAEYDFLLSDNPHQAVLKEQIAFLKKCDLHLFDRDGIVSSGVYATLVAGHTPGSVMY
ncbi:MAG: MBL fold metallo-hydrolase, partial [Clostridia bacterium]|nr:MBL fold metallo-hydrolase [Clostridia bacterium]